MGQLAPPCISFRALLPRHSLCLAGQLQVDLAQVVSWLVALPKLLWDLGGTAPDISAAGLRMLLDAARFSSSSCDGGALAGALTSLQPQLAPLLGVLVRQRLGQEGGKQRRRRQQQAEQGTEVQGEPAMAAMELVLVPGPLPKLPLSLQELGVDLIAHLPGAQEWVTSG